ncbi:LuxR C-terminal-related transcriptional regulator [Nesterenkonia ebinurensis]|uniref:LuxR C-terminal-related transcriptional regulator n=1 Tax=Nesterenkonia ebinurensis TaxID=2608252 RepID=UPI00123C8DFF
MSNQQIAKAMYLSEGTVKSYLSRAGQKLGSTGTRDNTLVQGVRQGLVEIRRVFLRGLLTRGQANEMWRQFAENVRFG